MSKYKIFTISDIHIGASDDELLYNQLDKYFFSKIEIDKPDLVVVCGDISHDKLSMNSIGGKTYLHFAKRLMQLCSVYNIKLRILMGTRSHDKDQLEIFEIEKKYLEDDIDMKIFRTVSSEKIFDDLEVLYVPEEYVSDKDEYYKEYLSNEYDFIFMHGLVTDAAIIAKHQESETTHLKAPIFRTEELIDITRGCVVSGHIHGHSIFKEKFYYIGSFTRWHFGEEETKGYLIYDYDTEDNSYKTTFIENKDAPIYLTINLTEKSDIFNKDVYRALEDLIRIKNSLKYTKLRFKIEIPQDYKSTKLFTDSVRELFNLDKNIVVLIKATARDKHEKKVKEQIETLMKMYDYIFNDSVLPEEKISRFIKTKFNKDISKETITKYIYK